MAFTEGANDGALNGTTEVTLVAAPAAATRRIVKSVTICNVDTVANEILVYVLNGASLRYLCKATLAVKDSLVFGEEDFIVLDGTGKSLRAKMGAAVTTTNPDFNACYADVT